MALATSYTVIGCHAVITTAAHRLACLCVRRGEAWPVRRRCWNAAGIQVDFCVFRGLCEEVEALYGMHALLRRVEEC